MISWIQTNFQHHFRKIFFALLVVIILSFVFVINQSSGLRSDDRHSREITLFGRPFNTPEQQRQITLDGQISRSLTRDQQADAGSYSMIRQAALMIADKFGVPQPTDAQQVEFIKTLPIFQGPDHVYSPQLYVKVTDILKNDPVYTEADVARVIGEDWRIAQVKRAIGGPGYISDDDIKQEVAQVDTKWSVSEATLDLTKLPPVPTPSEDQLKHWFETNKARYEIPPQTRVSYLEFPAANYLAQAATGINDTDIVNYFEENKARYRPKPIPPKQGEKAEPPAEPKLEAVRDQVKADLTLARATRQAAKAAADFAYQLFDQKIDYKSDAFTQLIARDNLALKSAGPVDAHHPPAGLNWNAQVLGEATSLSEKKIVSNPVTIGGNTLVLFFDESVPKSDATFALARDQVLTDWQADQRRQAIMAKGIEIRIQLTAALAAGQSFADAAKAAGLETRSWDNFTFRAPPQDFDYALYRSIQDLKVNEVTTMMPRGDKGAFAIVTARQTPQIATTDPTFVATRTQAMTAVSEDTANGILGSIVETELLDKGIISKKAD